MAYGIGPAAADMPPWLFARPGVAVALLARGCQANERAALPLQHDPAGTMMLGNEEAAGPATRCVLPTVTARILHRRFG